VLQPGQQAAAPSGIGSIAQQQLPQLRFRIDGARIAE
jgi:beta-barrel assembly-enhancing protease